MAEGQPGRHTPSRDQRAHRLRGGTAHHLAPLPGVHSQHSTARHGTARHGTARHSTAQHVQPAAQVGRDCRLLTHLGAMERHSSIKVNKQKRRPNKNVQARPSLHETLDTALREGTYMPAMKRDPLPLGKDVERALKKAKTRLGAGPVDQKARIKEQQRLRNLARCDKYNACRARALQEGAAAQLHVKGERAAAKLEQPAPASAASRKKGKEKAKETVKQGKAKTAKAAEAAKAMAAKAAKAAKAKAAKAGGRAPQGEASARRSKRAKTRS